MPFRGMKYSQKIKLKSMKKFRKFSIGIKKKTNMSRNLKNKFHNFQKNTINS